MLKSKKFEYGCLMANLTIKNWLKLATEFIEKDDIYGTKENGFGIQDMPHISILFGFHDKAETKNEVQTKFPEQKPFKATIESISCFETPDYDVIKFEVTSSKLTELNKWAKDNFEFTSTFPKYIPHLTVAYVKKGLGSKYKKEFEKKFDVLIDTICYSRPSGDLTTWKLSK